MSFLADIADAVVAELNAHTFSQTFTAARSWRPLKALEELSDLTVIVVPKGWTQDRIDRANVQRDVDIDVAVLKKLASGDNAECDGLMALVEEIAAFLKGRLLAAQPAACWMRVACDPIYSPQHYDEQRLFLSPQTHTYRVLG
jgi:hypothetical protein